MWTQHCCLQRFLLPNCAQSWRHDPPRAYPFCCCIQAARAAAAPTGTQQLEESVRRLEDKLKQRNEELKELQDRIVEAENHKKNLREFVEVGL